MLDRQVGTRRLYQTDPAGIAVLRSYLDQFWERSLAAFAATTRDLEEEERCTRSRQLSRSAGWRSCRSRRSARSRCSPSGSTSWWPSTHHIGEADIEEVMIEGHEGRPLVHAPRRRQRDLDRLRRDGTGRAASCSTWQIGGDWKFDPELVTHVEVRFVAEAADRTRVELEHRDLDRFGAEGAAMRAKFEEPGRVGRDPRALRGRVLRRARGWLDGAVRNPALVPIGRAERNLRASQTRRRELRLRGSRRCSSQAPWCCRAFPQPPAPLRPKGSDGTARPAAVVTKMKVLLRCPHDRP